MEHEVFAERVGPALRFDTALYFATGAESYRPQVVRSLCRLRYDASRGAVYYEPLAFFHARIIAQEVSETGRKTAVIAGRSVNGSSFMFRCPLHWLTSGKHDGARRFLRAFCNARGTLPSYVVPGKLAATIRAILALTEAGEPIPHSENEIALLDEPI